MHAKLAQGFDVVYAQRRTRAGEIWLKKLIAHAGYSVIARFSDVEIPRNTGDFRVMTRRVIEELRRLNETHGFLRGLVAFVGFSQTAILYDRDARYAGKGGYNRITGSIKIGLNGLISFSGRPLQMMSIAGALLAGLSFVLGAWYVFQRLVGIDLTPGLPTVVLVVTFFSGVQLLSLGLIGEYVGRIYDEVKGPPYVHNKAKSQLREMRLPTRNSEEAEMIGQFSRFAFIGAMVAGVQLLSFSIFHHLFDSTFLPFTVSYVLSIFCHFICNRRLALP